MAKTLTDLQVDHFRSQGWLAPLTALDAAQAADCAARISTYEATMGESANRSLKIKGHLAMPWLVELGRNQAILDRIPENRWGNPYDIAGGCLFLASPDSDYFNGAVINIDGGWLGR